MRVNKGHFTLVEVLMAMGAFLFACSILFGVLMNSTKQNVESVKLQQASIIATRELAKIQEYGFSGFGAPGEKLIEDSNFKGLMYSIKEDEIQPGALYQYTLKIYWDLTVNQDDPDNITYTAKSAGEPNQAYTILVARRD